MFQCIAHNKRIIIALVIALVLLSFFVSSFFSRSKNEIDLINFADSKDSLSSHIPAILTDWSQAKSFLEKWRIKKLEIESFKFQAVNPTFRTSRVGNLRFI